MFSGRTIPLRTREQIPGQPNSAFSAFSNGPGRESSLLSRFYMHEKTVQIPEERMPVLRGLYDSGIAGPRLECGEALCFISRRIHRFIETGNDHMHIN